MPGCWVLLGPKGSRVWSGVLAGVIVVLGSACTNASSVGSATTPSWTTDSPETTPPTTTQPGCPVNGTNVPGGMDPWGGCWPGPGNTGVPAETALTDYSGPCTITVDGTVIDSMRITCATLDIRAANVVITRSLLDGTDVTNMDGPGSSFTISDSTVRNDARDQCACIGYHDFTATRVEVIGGNRSMYCASHCTITDSWLHGQQLQGAQHGSGLREEQYTTATHNVLTCDYPIFDDETTLGCSAAMTGYADFAPIHDNTIQRNLFLSTPTGSYCAYGGASGAKPFSSDPSNATNQVFVENVFQRGTTGNCGFYAPVGDFDMGRPGNVFSGNVWDDGETVPVG
jgi:hypothetical protein